MSDGMPAKNARYFKSDLSDVNLADKIVDIANKTEAIYEALVVEKNAGVDVSGSAVSVTGEVLTFEQSNVVTVIDKGVVDAEGPPMALSDSTKDFSLALVGKIIRLNIDGVSYYRVIRGAINGALILDPIQDVFPASAVLSGEGSLRITTKEPGEAGNNYTIQLAAGSGTSQIMGHTLTGSELVITSATDTEGNPEPIAAGGLQQYINDNPELSALLVATDVSPGSLDLMDAPASFTSGRDEVVISAGTEYEILSASDGIEEPRVVPVDADGDEKFTQANPAMVQLVASDAEIGKVQISDASLALLAQLTTSAPSTGTKTVTSVAAEAFAGASALVNRKKMIIKNEDPVLRFRVGGVDITRDKGFTVEPKAFVEYNFDPDIYVPIYIIAETADLEVEVHEE